MGFVHLIPARRGSQGIALKNLQKIGERTLVEIAVAEAQASKYEGPVWVNSDAEIIANQCLPLGAKPYIRPPEFAGHNSTADDVVLDFISGVKLAPGDVVVYLQPTSPFRRAAHIDAAIEIFLRSGGIAVTSVTQVTQHPSKMLRRALGGKLEPLLGDGQPTSNRQELSEVLIPNGAIYIFSVAQFLQNGRFPIKGSIPYLMNEYESLDIDGPLDLHTARCLDQLKSEEIQ